MAVFCDHVFDRYVFLARRAACNFPKPEKFRDHRALIAHHGIRKRLIDRRRREAIQGPSLGAGPCAKRRGRSQRDAAGQVLATLFRIRLQFAVEASRAFYFERVNRNAVVLDFAVKQPLTAQILVCEWL